MNKPPPKRLHVLIIGGTRFIGLATAKRLLELGHKVTLFHRGETGNDRLPEIRHMHGEFYVSAAGHRGRRAGVNEYFQGTHPAGHRDQQC